MNLVHENRNNLGKIKLSEEKSVLKAWLLSNAGPSIHKFAQLENGNFKNKLEFSS